MQHTVPLLRHLLAGLQIATGCFWRSCCCHRCHRCRRLLLLLLRLQRWLLRSLLLRSLLLRPLLHPLLRTLHHHLLKLLLVLASPPPPSATPVLAAHLVALAQQALVCIPPTRLQHFYLPCCQPRALQHVTRA